MINHKNPSIANIGLTYGLFAALATKQVHRQPQALAEVVMTTLISVYLSCESVGLHYTPSYPGRK